MRIFDISEGEVGGALINFYNLIKASIIRETVRRMYTRKKLREMTVVCESFLEHLRVQSQVLVSALELTWPPAGWALCRPSRPPPQPTLPYFATRR